MEKHFLRFFKIKNINDQEFDFSTVFKGKKINELSMSLPMWLPQSNMLHLQD